MKTKTALKNLPVASHPAYVSFYHFKQKIRGKDMRKKCKEGKGRIGGWEGYWGTICILWKIGKQNLNSKVLTERVGTMVHSGAIHSHSLARGVQTFGVSGPHWKKSCLGLHIKYIAICNCKKKSHNVLREFTILCWATFTAILGCMRPTSLRLDTPGDLNETVSKDLHLETSGPWVHPLTGQKCFSFVSIWSVKSSEPDYNLVLIQTPRSRETDPAAKAYCKQVCRE